MSSNNTPRTPSPPMRAGGRSEGDSDVRDMDGVQEHSAHDIAIRVRNISKCYQIYSAPRDRLKQFVVPRLQRQAGQKPKQYFREFWALKDVSFEVKRGETVGIIGCNGSGKSTLLQIICGTLSPTSGSVETVGRIAALLELGSGFNPDFSGRENVFMNAAILGLSQKEIEDRFDEIAVFADIGDFMEQPVKTYSSGMVVRLAFSVSVCVEPDVLIIDEALAVGDAAFQFKCLDRMKRLTSKGATLLFVSHDMGMIKNFCNRAIYLRAGVERAAGVPAELAELYYLDIRDDQRRRATQGAGTVRKSTIGDGKGIAFGTEEGYVTAACFTNSGAQFSSYRRGEDIEVRVKVRYQAIVPNPSVSLSVQDRRMLVISEKYFLLSRAAEDEEWKEAGLTVRFPAIFSAGRYYVTVRLENRDSNTSFTPIDKQAGVLSFEVLDPNPDFSGLVDLQMHLV